MKKRIVSMMLALCMVFSVLAPVCVLAADDTVVFTAVDGTAGNVGENYTNVTDGKNSNGNFTKWCVQSHTPETYVVFRASLSSSTAVPVSVPLNSYTFITGNDTASHSGRNPKAWEVYGSNDYSESDKTGTWTSVHTVSNGEMPTTNFTSKKFEVNSNTYYKYYKFVIKEIVSETSGDLFQLCGIELEEKNEYPVTVCGTQVTLGNASDVLGDGTVSYSGGVLTLNGATLNYTEGSVIKSTADLKIELKGENKINGTLLNGKMLNFGDNTTFFGDGKLDVKSADINGVSAIGDVNYYAIYSGGDLNFENTEVNLTVGNITNTTIDEYLTCYGVYTPNDCNFVNSNVDVTTGDVSVKADKFFGYGICATNITFESGSLKATSGNVSNESGGVFISAVDSYGNFIVKSGTVEIATKDIVCSGAAYDYGVSCNSHITVENGATLISKVGNVKSSMSYIRALLVFDSIAVHNATLLAVGNGENATPLESESIAFTNANRVDYSVDGKAYATAIVPTGKKAVLPPKPSKDGYAFDEWCTDEVGKNKYPTDSAVNSDFNLYAKWKKAGISLGSSAIANGDPTNAKWDYVYFGEYNNTPTKWRVLSKNGSSTTRSDGTVDTATYKDSENNAYTGGAMFMLSEDLLGTAPFDSNGTTSVWIASNLYNGISSYFTSATGEEKYILKTTKKTPTFVAVPYDVVSFDGYSCDSYGDNMEDNTLFLLSAREVATYLGKPDANHIAKNNNTPNIWWLRSSGFNLNEPCYITDVGSVYSSDLFSWSSYGIRPGLNLASDKILFTSPAVNGKNVNAGLTAPAEYTGNEYKLTLLDTERKFALTDTTVKTVKGGTVEIGYKNAKTGENEYISAIITDENGDLLYYGQVGKVISKDGTGKAVFGLPSDFDSSKHTLKLFNEQINDDKKTDFASDFVEVSVTIGTAKTVNLGVSVLKGGQATNVYFGGYQQTSLGNEEPKEGKENVDWVKSETATQHNMGGYYSKDPVKWRVLGISNGNALLLSDKNLDVVKYHTENESVTWGTSTMRSWLNGLAANQGDGDNAIDYTNDNFIDSAFTEGEKVSIVSTALSSESNDPDTNDKIFLLSVDEAKNTSYFKDKAARVGVNTEYVYGGGRNGSSGMYSEGRGDFWLLRSPGDHQSYAACVGSRSGDIGENGTNVNHNSIAVRPAFNLNLESVLFTTPAEGGKNVNAGLTAPAEYTGNEYKLTLLDTERKFALTDTTVKTVKDGTVEIGYKNAKTGDNEYISAIITDENGDVLYYGQVGKVTSKDGTGKAIFSLPSDFDSSKHTLKLFNEQINGDKKSDFASDFVEVSVTIGTAKTVNLGVSVLKGGQATNVYFGRYQQTSLGNEEPKEGKENVDWVKSETATHNNMGGYYSKDPVKWRVLGISNGNALLLSDKNLDVVQYHTERENVTWGTSTMRSWLNGLAANQGDGNNAIDYTNDNFIDSAFTEGEKVSIASTVIKSTALSSESNDPDTNDKIFLLSVDEAKNTSYFKDNAARVGVNTEYVYGGGRNGVSGMYSEGGADFWWLRSPGGSQHIAADVNNDGDVNESAGYVSYVNDAVRPAFNLDLSSVLFTTPAVNGKNVNAGLTAPTEYTGNEYKLTLLDRERANFKLKNDVIFAVIGDGTATFNYEGAKTGDNEHISAMILDGNGTVLYYGQVGAVGNSASGSVTFTVPDSLAAGDYTVKIFNEQVNGAKQSNFASEPKTATLKVRNSHKVTLNTNGADSCTALTSYLEGEGATLPTPTRKGYTFGGWFENRNLTGTAVTSISATETQDKEFFAKWNPIDYKITYNLNGGTASNPTSYNIETATFSLNAPAKSGYRFIGWSGTGLNGNDNLTVVIEKGSTENRNYEAHYLDIAAPTGTVTVGENSWNAFLNTITFGLFFNKTQQVEITATDNSGATVKIEYLLSENALTKAELDAKTFTAYTDKFNINPDNEYVVYAKLTDATGNVTYINSNGVVLDGTAPVISGIENGKTYCEAQTVTVSDKYEVTVTVNGTPITLDANGQFTLSPVSGTQTVVAKDQAGNVSAQMVVTVNNGHTDKNKDHICDVETCKATISACSGGTATCKAPAVCGYCGEEYGAKNPNNHTDSVAVYKSTDERTHKKVWNCCGKVVESGLSHDFNDDGVCNDCGYGCNHTGGTATCTEKAVCTNCGKPYGTTNPNNHSFTEEKAIAKYFAYPANCLSPALYYKSCVCGEKGTDTFEHGEKGAHNFEGAEWKQGNTQHYKCCVLCTVYRGEWEDHKSTGENVANCQHANICDTCDKVYGTKDMTKHTDITEWTVKTESEHEQKWKCCGEVSVKKAAHDFNDDGVCNDCGYALPKYTVTYTDGKNGEVFADEVYTVVKGQKTPAFSKDISNVASYNFLKWDKNISDTVTGDVTYTAKWSNKTANVLALHGNGGLTSDGNDFYNSYSGGNTITLRNVPFTRKGYSFSAWNTLPNGKGKWYAKRATVDFTAPHNAETVDLYAIWSVNYYKIIFNGNGAAGTMKNLNMRYDKSEKLLENEFSRDGFEFVSWNTQADGKGVSYSDTEEVINLTDVADGEVILYAQWKDIGAPTGEIKIGENIWNNFLNGITFGLFFKDTQTVEISAADNSEDAVTVEYLLSDSELTLEELASKTFTPYTDKFNINPDNEYVVYAKLTDSTGNVAYINSNGVVLDNTAPVISGVENGETYCSAQTVTVSDKYEVDVTVNGVAVTLDADGKFTLSPAEGEQKITVTDKSGNTAEVTVTVNDGHTGGTATCTEKAECSVCGEEYGDVNPDDHDLERVPETPATVTSTGNTEYWYCKDCGNYYSDENGKNKIDPEDVITPKLPPEIIEGMGQSVTEGEKEDLSFRSNAGFDDFIRVEVDGETIDETNYDVKEGSTIVTLKADYIATLSVGVHTLGVVSQSGTATTTFVVNAKEPETTEPTTEPTTKPTTEPTTETTTESTPEPETPKTGDENNALLWILVLAATGGTLTATVVVFQKKKRYAR